MRIRGSAALAALTMVVASMMSMASTVSLAGPAGADPSTSPPSGTGEWQAEPDGTVTPIGGAPWYGDVSHLDLWEPVVGIISTPTGDGYWLVARDSGVFAFGDASYQGNLIDALIARDDLPPGVLNGSNILDYLEGEIVDAVAAPAGHGYWLLGADGGVFDFGSATFQGSVSGRLPAGWLPLATDIAPTGTGYRIEVFLYRPDSTAGPDGTISGITQAWACGAGTCDFEGQRLDHVEVPGIVPAPPEPPPPPAPPDPPPPSPDPPPPEPTCDPNYSPCIPPFPPDLDCDDIGRPVTVIGSDPHGLDSNSDGSGCESHG